MAEQCAPLSNFTGPRYWLTWAGFALLWCTSRLPFRWQLFIGKWLGRGFFLLLRRRRHIADTNLRLCFPELDDNDRRQLLRWHFESLGIMLIEIGLSWWASAERLKKLIRIEGLDHLQHALAGGKGAILLAAHFTSLEISGQILSLFTPVCAMYRRHENKLINAAMERGRLKQLKALIPREDIRGMLRTLKEGYAVWYAPDQNYRGKWSVIVPFFGVPVPTNAATSRIARASGAPVLPFAAYRLNDNSGYIIKISPPLENFPSEDIEQDTLRFNRLTEAQIREFPEQYLWVHRRFKGREADVYHKG